MFLVLIAGLLLSTALLGVVLFLAWKRRRNRTLQPLGYERLAFPLPHSDSNTSMAENQLAPL